MKELSRIVAEMITRESVKSGQPGLEKQAKRSKLLGNTNGKYPNLQYGDQNLTSVDYKIPEEPLREPMIVM